MFAFASLLGGLSHGLPPLLFARALQGTCAALLVLAQGRRRREGIGLEPWGLGVLWVAAGALVLATLIVSLLIDSPSSASRSARSV